MWRKETLATRHDSRHAESQWVSSTGQVDSYEIEPVWWPLAMGLSAAAGVILVALWLLIGFLEWLI